MTPAQVFVIANGHLRQHGTTSSHPQGAAPADPVADMAALAGLSFG